MHKTKTAACHLGGKAAGEHMQILTKCYYLVHLQVKTCMKNKEIKKKKHFFQERDSGLGEPPLSLFHHVT